MNIAANLIEQLGEEIGEVRSALDELIDTVHQQLDEVIVSLTVQESDDVDPRVAGLGSIMSNVELLGKRLQHLSEVYVTAAAQPLFQIAREIQESAEALHHNNEVGSIAPSDETV